MFMNFKITPENSAHLKTILDRVEADSELGFDRTSASMNLIATHNGGCPLDFERMAKAERLLDLLHDVYGIASCLDRETGELKGHFLPRFAARQVDEEHIHNEAMRAAYGDHGQG